MKEELPLLTVSFPERIPNCAGMVLYALFCVEGSKDTSMSGAERRKGDTPEFTASSLLLGASGVMFILVICYSSGFNLPTVNLIK